MCFQAPNVGVGGKDHGNRTSKKEYCYLVKFYDENSRLLCAEPYTVTEEDADHAYDVVERQVSKDMDLHDYYDASIQLEDVC